MPISILYFVSGATGLVYEVVWAKYLALLFGSTALAHTIVLSTFMGGLAIGNALFGPWADRSDSPLRLYGRLEFAIALFAVVPPVLFPRLAWFYGSLIGGGMAAGPAACVKIALAAAVLLIPTALMGGTLPAIIRSASKSSSVQSAVSRLYFVNSAGAVFGCLAAGFWLIPSFGLDFTVSLTAIGNAVAGGCAVYFAAKGRAASPSNSSEPQSRREALPRRPAQLRILFAGVFLGGLAAMACEIGWIRLLALIMGSSAYSFSMMLAAFISGVAAGSWLVSRGALPKLDSYLFFGLAQASAGLTLALSLPLYGRLPWIFLLLGTVLERSPGNFYLFEGLKFLLAFALMFVPTCLLGMALPLAASVPGSGTAPGRDAGRLFAINTLGNVAGAVLAGLFLLPALGIQRLFEGAALLNLLVGCAVMWTASRWTWRTRAAVAGGALALFAATTGTSTPLSQLVLSSGTFRGGAASDRMTYSSFLERLKDFKILYYRDDPEATVTVFTNKSGLRWLRVNGKTDASDRDLASQELVAHIPLLLKPGASDVLMVGLGSGISAGSALRHPIKRLDAVEIVPAMAPAAEYFKDVNGDALHDPRFHLHFDDARSFVKVRSGPYDVIINEPSNPWVAGVANVFSAEFYADLKARLKPGGLVCQWFQLYESNNQIVKLVLRTFTHEFRGVTLWRVGADIVMVGSNADSPPDPKGLEREFARAGVRADLKRIEIGDVSQLMSMKIADDADVRGIAGRGRLNEDLFPVLEYEAPKTFYTNSVADVLRMMDPRGDPSEKISRLSRGYANDEAQR